MSFKLKEDRKAHLTVSEDILAELGRIMVFQVIIESALENSISKLLKIDNKKVSMITAELSFKQLVALLSSLVLDIVKKDGTLFKEFMTLKSKLHKFETFRNMVSHSIWTHSTDFTDSTKALRSKTTSKEKGGLKFHHEEVEIKELIKMCDFAGEIQVELYFFMTKLGDSNPNTDG